MFALFLATAAVVPVSAVKPPATRPGAPASVNVSLYGATGDGISDDGPAIQAAIDELSRAGHGKLVFEPFGVYRVGRRVVFSNAGDFEVDGQGATIKPLDAATVLTTDGDTMRFVRCSRFSVHDLTFDGNRAVRGAPTRVTTPVTLRLNGCSDFVVRDCRFRDSVCDDVFLWCGVNPRNADDHCTFGRITGCTMEGPWRNCVSAVHAAFIRVDHNTFRDARTSAPQAGIDVEPNPGDAPGITHHIDVESNTFVGCGVGAAAYFGKAGTHHVTFAGNRVSSCKVGLYSEATGTVFRGNVLDDSPLVAANCDAARVIDNVVTGSYVHADTAGVANPEGHVLVNNVADQIHTYAAGGRTVSQGNVTTGKPAEHR